MHACTHTRTKNGKGTVCINRMTLHLSTSKSYLMCGNDYTAFHGQLNTIFVMKTLLPETTESMRKKKQQPQIENSLPRHQK